MIWWSCLSAIAFLNVCLLVYSYRLLKKKMPSMTPLLQMSRTWQFRLSSVYVFGCGFRSIVPRGDLERVTLIDSFISSVVVGRSVATIAELCFVAQWAWLLYEIGKQTNNKTILFLSKILVPIIVVAEVFSWYAYLTTNYIGSAIEESLWAVTATLALVGFVLAIPYYGQKQLTFLKMAVLASIGYVIYMVTVDVPNYVNGWLAAEANGKEYLSIREGFWEVTTQWTVTHAYVDWQ